MRRRKDGRWQIDIVYWRRGERMRLRKAAHAKNRGEALEAERRERSKLDAGAKLVGTCPTFEDFAAELMTFAVANNKHSEIETKRVLLEKHLVPHFGHLTLDEISAQRIEAYKSEKLATHKPKSVNNHLTVLRRALSLAHEWDRLAVVPRIRWLKIAPTDLEFLDFEEAARLSAHAGDARPMIVVGLRTGLRQGELLALEWGDVDLVAGRLVVRRAVYDGMTGSPKGGRAREVPLSDDAREALRGLPSRFRSGLVFVDAEGKQLTKGACKWPLWSACRRAGIKRVGWHALRHTFASQLTMNGVNIKAVQELLGHTDIKTTLRYAHLSPNVTRDAVRTLDGRDTLRTRSDQKGR